MNKNMPPRLSKKQLGRHNIFIRLSKLICDIVNELFGLFPAEAGVSDRLAVGTFFNLLAAVNDVALDHKALYDLADIVVVAAAVENFVADPDLLHKLLAGVCVVCVNDNSHIFEILCAVHIVKTNKVLVVVVGVGVAVLVNIASENCVGKGIALAACFPASVEECVL